MNNSKPTEWFLRIALSTGMLSAVADRFGFWSKDISAWGNWQSFVEYTGKLNPFVPEKLLNPLAIAATFFEILLGVMLLIPFKTELFAKATGILLLLFGVAMVVNLGIKAPLDYSVFAASAAAFALAQLVKVPRD